MIKQLKNIMLSFAVLGAFFAPALVPAVVSAQLCEGGISECAGAGINATDPGNEGVDATEKVNEIITLVINVFSYVVGFVAVVMIIVGGFKYITSGGDSGNVTSAKNTIMFAIVGLVIVALAQIIVKFVLQKVTAQ